MNINVRQGLPNIWGSKKRKWRKNRHLEETQPIKKGKNAINVFRHVKRYYIHKISIGCYEKGINRRERVSTWNLKWGSHKKLAHESEDNIKEILVPLLVGQGMGVGQRFKGGGLKKRLENWFRNANCLNKLKKKGNRECCGEEIIKGKIHVNNPPESRAMKVMRSEANSFPSKNF